MIDIASLYSIFQQHPSVCTDTRQVKAGDIFFALKGPSFNGNAFAAQALAAGAAYAVVDEAEYATAPNILLTDDCLTTLQALAKHHRQQFTVPVIGITGSNGKTTTKELIHAVLSSSFKTYTTQGNLNNHIGIPLTLLRIQPDAEMAVVEMGANHLREIASYCTYALPTHGLITNCGKAHLEGFGSLEGVRKGKGELFDHLRQTNGTAFICDDFDYFHDMAKGLPHQHWYGTGKGEVVGHVLQSEPFLRVEITAGFDFPVTIHTNLVGSYNLYNVLAACTVGRFLNISIDAIRQAIEAYQPSNSRSQLVEKAGNKIILDAYNANPASMAAAIENFAQLDVNNKILFLGAMMEMGDASIAEHEALLALIAKYNWKEVVLVGGDFANTAHDHRYFNNADEAAAWWKQQTDTGNYLLVKGSRSMKMEKIVS